ncbi:MAG: carbon-nitrogen hydrolase family protein [Thermoleophilia bacterium]|nr:carbon-nitrogen hydrolase family protein [Thermoleophilia bacterium]
MSRIIRAAVLQMNSGEDVGANLRKALGLVREAALRGAELLVLPEKFHYLGRRPGVATAKQSLDGPVLGAMGEAARENGVYVVAGSIWEAVPGEERTYNTTVLFGPDGRMLAGYRKIHMFDVDVGGHAYRESDDCRPGDEVVAVRVSGLPRGTAEEGAAGGDLVLGLTVCYDIRFPDLYAGLAELGARVVTVPAAFTLSTGKDHWEVLLRARAIENQVFMVAANQFGRHEPGLESYGRSMIVDPWGIVLAQVGHGEGVALADLDLDRLEKVRGSLPSLANRAPAAYGRRRLIEPG